MNRLIIAVFLLFSVFSVAQSTASPQVSTFAIESIQLGSGAGKKIWIYLPQDYNRSNRKYPVLYMHDAQNLFDAKTSYAGEWEVDETLDSIHAQVIVVGIEHGNDKRIDELTPYENEKYGGGHADLYLDFIVTTLKPYIDKNYRTKTNAKNTGIMGSSLGGLVSYYAVLKYPKVFGKAGVFSPSFWFTKDIYTLTQKTEKIKAKLYFACGDSESDDIDMVGDIENMYDLVAQKRSCRKLQYKIIIPGGKHNEKLWREQFLNAYLWLF